MVTGTHGRSDRAVLGGKPLAAQTVRGEGTVPGGAQGLALRRGPSSCGLCPPPRPARSLFLHVAVTATEWRPVVTGTSAPVHPSFL